jgi:hypothetical protein
MSGYNVTVNQNTVANQTNKQFNGGIHSNVTLESVTFESPRKDGEGDKVLMFNFKGQNSETFRHLEWAIDESKSQDPQKAYENQGKRIKHILSKFIAEDAIIIEGVSSYAEFSAKVIELLGTANISKTVAIKLTYNAKGNLEFTKYLGFIGNNAADLQIGKNEMVTKPQAQPTADPLGDDLGADDMNLDVPSSSDTPF